MENGATKPVTTLVLALELPDQQVMRIAKQLASLREATRAFVPMLVSSCPSLKAIRDLGILHEYLVSYQEWSVSRDPAAWSGYALNRVKLINNEVHPGNILIAGDLLRVNGIDRNLYGALLTLIPPPPSAPELPGLVKDEIAAVDKRIAALDERLGRIDRAIRKLQSALTSL
jgi:hypothetical protein